MEIFGNYLKDGEATNLLTELERLLPKLQRLYRSGRMAIDIELEFSARNGCSHFR